VDILVAEIPALEFDLEAAAFYGRLRARLESKGTPIGPNDTLIAAQALARSLVVVTDNVGEFGRVKGLRVENWRDGPGSA
jgi:tRNA(fMet)-specific endonuclease VapC